jgi:tetratricopeptide (TPR) repeat protein
LLRRSRGDEQYPKAREPAEKALTCVQKGLGLNHALVVPVLDTLAAIDIDEGRYVKAADRCRQRQPVAEHIWGEEAVRLWGPGHGHAFLIEGLNCQARVRTLVGKYGEAEDCVKQAQKMCEVSLGRKEHPSWASTLSTRGRLEIARHNADENRPSEARRPLENARKILEALFGKAHPDLARTLGDLASLDSGPSTSTRGITQYERAIAGLETSCGAEHPDVARLYCGVALLYQEQKKWDDAAKKLDRALEIQHKMLRADHPDLATTLEAYAELLKNMKPANPDRAAELLAKAKEIRRDHAAKEAAAASGGT